MKRGGQFQHNECVRCSPFVLSPSLIRRGVQFADHPRGRWIFTASALNRGYQNAAAEWIFIVFMFIAGANFALQYRALLRRDFRPVVFDEGDLIGPDVCGWLRQVGGGGPKVIRHVLLAKSTLQE